MVDFPLGVATTVEAVALVEGTTKDPPLGVATAAEAVASVGARKDPPLDVATAEEAMPAYCPGAVDILDELLGEGEEMVIDVPQETVPPRARREVSCQTDHQPTTLTEIAQEVARLQTLIVVEVSGLRRQIGRLRDEVRELRRPDPPSRRGLLGLRPARRDRY
jgi:hypothetical protein